MISMPLIIQRDTFWTPLFYWNEIWTAKRTNDTDRQTLNPFKFYSCPKTKINKENEMFYK